MELRTLWGRPSGHIATSCISLILLTLSAASIAQQKSPPQWQRSVFVYANANRSVDQWRRHFLRIDSNGKFTSQRMFDSIILSIENFVELPRDKQNEDEITKVLDQLFLSASNLDKALDGLGLPLIDVTIGSLYFNNENVTIKISGTDYRLSIPSNRDQVSIYYARTVKSRAENARWRNLRLYGTYYMNEEVVQQKDDARYIRSINKGTHDLGMSTVWVPVDGSGLAWEDGANLGFNVTVVQPGYAFLSSIDEGALKGDRLYNLGYRSANMKRNYEYEVRSCEVAVGHYIAHQYLAVSQVTGAFQYPQVFFIGGMFNFLDNLENKNKAVGYQWATYEDLANYLKGDKIQNLEIDIPWTPTVVTENMIEIQWIVPESHENLNSIRFDFQEATTKGNMNSWRGWVSVQVGRDGPTSFTYRMGYGRINPLYNSVFVPINNFDTRKTTLLKIQLNREPDSSWPMVLRLVAAKFEPQVIANPLYEEVSRSSNAMIPKDFKDSQDTHLGFKKGGKLTDGVVSPIDVWWWGGVMGWHWLEYPFSVTIDLGSIQTISSVKLVGHVDPNAAVGIPNYVGALVSSSCEPHPRGIVGLSCIPTASTGGSLVTIASKTGDLRNLTLDFEIDSITSKRRVVVGRYVTVSGRGGAWNLLDEIEVANEKDLVISKGASYKITPITGVHSGGEYSDNNGRLLDGNIFPDWVFGTAADGISSKAGEQSPWVEATWTRAKVGRNAVIWFTKASPGFGIGLPDWVQIQWRDPTGSWIDGGKVVSSYCGLSPCAKLKLPPGKGITGIRGIFPNGFFMVTEISMD